MILINSVKILQFHNQTGEALSCQVAAPPSETDPAGIFTMNYTARMAGQSAGGGFIKGRRADGGKFVLEMAEETSEGEGKTQKQYVIAELQKVGDDFSGMVVSSEDGKSKDGTRTSNFKIRFDASYVNVDGAKTEEYNAQKRESTQKGCYDRNKFKTGIYRYDLVDAAGETKKLKSGFPIELDSGGKTYQGNASYWGIWLPGNVKIDNGATVNKSSWKNGGVKEKTPYAVVKADGKLVKYTKAEVKLSTLKGADLMTWENGSGYIARWDASTLTKAGKQTRDDNGNNTEEAATGTVTIPQWGLNVWIPSLNANVNIPGGTTLSDNFSLVYHSQDVVSGSATGLGDLVCFSNCPVMAPTAAAFTRQTQSNSGPRVSDLYLKTTVNWGNGSQQVNQGQNISSALATYTFNETAKVIASGGASFALPTDLVCKGDGKDNFDNVRSGTLVPTAVWAPISNKNMNPWEMENNVDVYYRWEAGASQWNKYMALKNASSAIESFDKPLEFSYGHTTANDFDGSTDTAIVGRNYRLNYGGPGQFWGIPWKYNADIGHEAPLFSIKSGTAIGDYKIYGVEAEQRIVKVEDAKCATLDLGSMPALPKADTKDINHSTLGASNPAVKYIGGVAVTE